MKQAASTSIFTLLLFLWCAGAAAAAERTVLLYGDSLLAGLGLDANEGFQAQLQAAIDEAGLDAKVVNASVSGDTTSDGLERLEWTLGESPDAVILGLGANDMLRGLTVDDTRRNMDVILSRMSQLNLPVLVLGMKADRGLGADYVRVFDAIYPELAEQHDVLFYPFYLQAIGLEPAFFQPDLRHPNSEGVKRIVANLLPAVKELLGQIQ